MAKATPQAKLERTLSELYEQFERTLPKQRKAVTDGISAARPTAATPETIEAMERNIYRAYTTALRAELERTVSTSVDNLATALIAALGPVSVMELAGVATAVSVSELAKSGLLNGLIFVLIFGIDIADFAKSLVEAMMSRTSSDGKNTRQRIRIFANEVAEEITKAITTATRSGRSQTDILGAIDEVLREADWRVDRLVDTESMTAYRTSVTRIVEDSDVFSAVRIIDFPEGHEDVHHRHNCYKYARADEHGLGNGIYPATTRKIRNPHPQCRSILVPILAEGEEA